MIKTYANDYDPEVGSSSEEMDDEPPEMIVSDRPKPQAVKTKTKKSKK